MRRTGSLIGVLLAVVAGALISTTVALAGASSLRELGAEEARGVLGGLVAGRMGFAEEEVTLELVSWPKKLEIPTGELGFDIPAAPEIWRQAVYSGFLSVPAKLLVDGRPAAEIRLRARVSVTAPVVVCSADLVRGQVVTMDMVKLEPRKLAGLPMDVARSVDEVLGRCLTRNLSRGEPVRTGLTKLVPIVKFGENLTIRASFGSVVITVPGRSLSDGGAGDLIKVQNLSSHRVLTARVVEPGLVEVAPAANG